MPEPTTTGSGWGPGEPAAGRADRPDEIAGERGESTLAATNETVPDDVNPTPREIARAAAATDGPRTAPWESYDVGDQVQVRDPWYGTAVPRRALVKAKDPHGPAVAYTREDRPRVKVRYLDTQAVAWVAAKRIAGVVREVSSGV